jgi:hypothetical protein
MRTRSIAVLALAGALASAAHALGIVEVWQAARTHDPEYAAALAARERAAHAGRRPAHYGARR